jgi:O-succinylbenzoic acid--CoA ligase
VDLGDLRRTVAGRLGRAAAPRRLVVVDALPMLASGKPDRVRLTALAAAAPAARTTAPVRADQED